MTRRRSFTSASSPKTTAHELSTELARFAADLKATAAELGGEIDGIERDIAEIREERDAAVGTFVDNTVEGIDSAQIDVLSDIAAKDDAVRGQSLSFVRNQMVKERADALAAINGTLDGVTDAEGVRAAVADAQAKYEQAVQVMNEAQDVERTAAQALRAWMQNPEYKLVTLSEQIQAKGGLAVNQENRAYYEPKWIWTAAINFLTRDGLYRDVRRALVAYGHEEDGKDAFAEMANYRAKTDSLKQEMAQAQARADEMEAVKADAQRKLDGLDDKAEDIRTDAQILEVVRAQVVEYMAAPSFVSAVAAHYAEDFPQALPLLSAKVSVLEKLRAGAQEKLEAIQENILAVMKQQTEVAKLRAGTELGVDIEEVRRRNAGRRAEYDNYTTATRESWNRTRTYEYNRRGSDTVYADRSSPSILEWILIERMLNGDNDRPSSTSSYTTDMLKLDRKEAVDHGISERVFDISPEVSRKMEDLGIQHYERTGTFSFDVSDKANDYVTSRVDEAVRETVREAVREDRNFSFDANPGRSSSPSRSEEAREERHSSPSPRHS